MHRGVWIERKSGRAMAFGAAFTEVVYVGLMKRIVDSKHTLWA